MQDYGLQSCASRTNLTMIHTISVIDNLGSKYSLGRAFVGKFDNVLKLNIAIDRRKGYSVGKETSKVGGTVGSAGMSSCV